MSTVWLVTRTRLSHRVPATIALALAVGIAAGAALFAFAGARRTDSAVRRLVAYEQPAEGSVDPQDPSDSAPDLLAQVARLPEVATSMQGAFMLLGESSQLSTFAFVNPPTGHSLVVEGR